MSLDKQTIATYDKSAKSIAQHFQTYRANYTAQDEISEAFKLAGDPRAARVVEVGCGTGKDALAISSRAAWYEGFDPSLELLKIAREQAPGASFVQADALSYGYPEGLDIVFAFASMLHMDKKDFEAACDKIADALRPGGVLCISLKEADEFASKVQTDKFGERLFYFYNPKLVCELAGPNFKQIYEEHMVTGPEKKRWFVQMLQRV